MTYEYDKKRIRVKTMKRTMEKESNIEDSDNIISEATNIQSRKLPVNDHLALTKLRAAEIPESILFPEELHNYLRTEIQALTSENGRLQRCLAEKQEALNRTNSSSPLFGLGRASELAASKIVELSKRVRELTAECEGHKSRLRTRSQDKKPKPVEETEKVVDKDPELEADQLKVLSDKLSATNIKLCESRNQCQQLRKELKLANKALICEVGENVSLQNITSTGSSWRGRAQQIISLQQKLADLQGDGSGEKIAAEPSGASLVRQMEKERRASQEQTAQQLHTVTQELEDTRRKLEAARVRCRILEGEKGDKKKLLDKLIENAKHDAQLIKAMTTELETKEKKLLARESDWKQRSLQAEERRKCLTDIATKERERADQLQALLAEREGRLLQLEAREERQASFDRCELEPKSPEPPAVLQVAEAERLRLLELVSVLNRRLSEQRSEAELTQNNLSKERARCARLETRVGRLEMEKPRRSNGYTRTKEIPEEVQNKLEIATEEVLTLKTRLKCVEQEKEDDLKIYTSSLEEARRMFLESSRNRLEL